MKDAGELELETRLRVLLPETYELFDGEVQPISMGSAGLKFGLDGRVLWDEMWGSFCDLAMAGGPPHRGTFLEPDWNSDLLAPAYQEASAEICRGISLVTGLCAEPSAAPGWVRMYCTSAAMAGWLMRAIVMENVSAAGHGLVLSLPTGPAFQLQKEVKNVITATAKTCHYWQDHMSDAKHDEIADLLARMEREAPLLRPGVEQDPPTEESWAASSRVAEAIGDATGLEMSGHRTVGWLGVDCREIAAAIWMMRALVVSNLLSRREGTVVFLPIDAASDPTGERSVHAFIDAHRLAAAHHLFA